MRVRAMDVVRAAFMTERELMRFAAQNRDRRFEIIDGEIVDMAPIGMMHNFVSGSIFRVLYDFVTPRKFGYVFTDNLIYTLHRDPETGIRTTRVPDGSFVRKGRIPKDFDLSLPFPGAPDLAIEVMFPDDTVDDLMERINDYFTYGTEQVWVFYPRQREVHQHIRDEVVIHIYRASDTITAESLLPGLSLSVDDLFAVPEIDD